jgi:hypothetical protein
MPKAADLPENMRLLYRRQFVEIDNTRFEDDVRNLAEAIKKVLPDGSIRVQPERHDEKRHEEEKKKTEDKKTPLMPRPGNNLVLAIIAVIFCLPLGVVSVMAANKVDSLWLSGQYHEAVEASKKAKNWAISALVMTVVVYMLYAIILAGNA